MKELKNAGFRYVKMSSIAGHFIAAKDCYTHDEEYTVADFIKESHIIGNVWFRILGDEILIIRWDKSRRNWLAIKPRDRDVRRMRGDWYSFRSVDDAIHHCVYKQATGFGVHPHFSDDGSFIDVRCGRGVVDGRVVYAVKVIKNTETISTIASDRENSILSKFCLDIMAYQKDVADIMLDYLLENEMIAST